MPTYRAIASTETDPEAPLTSALAKALADNPLAIAEQAAGAPKIRHVNVVSGASGFTQTFTGLGDYGGVEFSTFGVNTGGAVAAITIQYSTDGGSTWSTAFTLASVPGTTGTCIGEGFLDFASGTVGFAGRHAAASGAGTNYQASGTMAGASLAIDAVRFTFGGGNGVAMLRPKGATV